MKHLQILTLAILLIVTAALLPAFGYQQGVDVQAMAGQNLATVAKLQALSIQLQSLPRKDRVAFARQAAEELGFNFLEPTSMEGKGLINMTVAKRIVQIYASDLSIEEKREQARAWAADADLHFEIVPGVEPSGRLAVKKPGKKKLRIQADCEGTCGNLTILEGSGCVLTCQQWGCGDPFFYIECSQTRLVCPDSSPTDFGFNCNESCPCAQ